MVERVEKVERVERVESTSCKLALALENNG
jgi:hypothetical protein